MNMLDDIHVVANATPLDKLLMLQCLRQKCKVVAATGTSIRDTPLLKEADVGFFLGDTAAEMAKENSDIIVMDRNFGTIFAILEMGRYVCKIVEKFCGIATYSQYFIIYHKLSHRYVCKCRATNSI